MAHSHDLIMNVTSLFATTPQPNLSRSIARLAASASIEMNVHDVQHVTASRAHLRPATKIYVTHLPKQSWDQTIAACATLRTAGFDPVAHIPVRLLTNRSDLDNLLTSLRAEADVGEVLLIAGDYAHAHGPYASVLEVLQTDRLQTHGLTRVSLAGHPEGHPRVALDTIRRAEIDKAQYCDAAGLEATFVTQFCFESAPFLEWARALENAGVQSRLVAGIAAPAKLSTLVNFGLRCGVGPSIRALSAKPGVLRLLMAEHAPDEVVAELARAIDCGESSLAGLHVFCLGGWLRACSWLQSLTLDDGRSRQSLHDRSL